VAMQDAMLKNDIIAALEWEPDIDLGTAGVSVIEGLVTLFGRVGTMPQRDAVERAVLRVRGVATVTNEIEVAASRSERPAPAEHRGGPGKAGTSTSSRVRSVTFRRLS
jgi:hypothetical protein